MKTANKHNIPNRNGKQQIYQSINSAEFFYYDSDDNQVVPVDDRRQIKFFTDIF
jgi:hypothetical protein